jgi:hypothetical protein
MIGGMVETFSRSKSFLALLGLLALLGWMCAAPAVALDLAQLTNQQPAQGIKGALTSGATVAINRLGVPGGFLNNPKLKIPLPPALDEIAKGLRMLGRGKDADELVAAMNQAEEQVTQKTLEGLYVIIGEEERAIRQNPMAAGSAIVSKVFGALKN